MEVAPCQVPGDGRTLDAHLALPARGRGPAVIVIHEIFGPDAHIQDVAKRFAQAGYVALAPDLFTGEIQHLLTPQAVMAGFGFLRSLPPEVQRDPAQIQAKIAERPAEEQKLLAGLMKIQDPMQHRAFARDLAAVARHLREQSYVEGGRVGSVGFCFGGGIAGLLACTDPDLRAAVIFYGNTPPKDLLPKARCPILGLYGGEDHRITDTVPAFVEDAKSAGVPLTYHIYPGAQHAFFNDSRPQVYNAAAAADAWERVQTFFQQTLAP